MKIRFRRYSVYLWVDDLLEQHWFFQVCINIFCLLMWLALALKVKYSLCINDDHSYFLMEYLIHVNNMDIIY